MNTLVQWMGKAIDFFLKKKRTPAWIIGPLYKKDRAPERLAHHLANPFYTYSIPVLYFQDTESLVV